MPLRHKLLPLILLLGILLPALPCQSQSPKGSSLFFVFNNGIRDSATYKSPEQQVALAARIGFSGVEKAQLDDFERYYQAIKASRLKLFTIYTGLNLDDAQNPYDPRLEEVFRLIRNTESMPWIYITSKRYAPSSENGDSIAVLIIRQVADLAGKYNLNVTLYPHTWFWLESVDDAIRIVQKVDRKNVGITFNLPHYLATQYYAGQDPVQNFPAYAAKAQPYLFALSVNGADFPPPSGDRGNIWETFIQPLGEGKYDTYGFLKTFWDLGFRGPMGLQCYNIKAPKTSHLKLSVETYKAWQKRYQTQAKSN